MSGAPAAPVTTISATSPCRATDGVTVTLSAAAAGAARPNTTATTPIRSDPRNVMPRLYAQEGRARRIQDRAGNARIGRGGGAPPPPGESETDLRGLGALLAKELLDLRHEIRRRRQLFPLPAAWLHPSLLP